MRLGASTLLYQVDETPEVAKQKELPEDFFTAGFNRVIEKGGAVSEESL